MSNRILKDAGLSRVSDSSSSSELRGRRADKPHPIAMVRATRVIDIDLEFNEPTTKVVDDMTERDSVGEPSADEASTSEAMAPIVSGGFLPVVLTMRLCSQIMIY
ncbi:hypothetical protein ACOSP7_013200 [Xanthoceras sorbifolium]